MNIEDIKKQNIDVETLPDEVHKELTVHKLANELINMTLLLEKTAQSNDPKKMKIEITQIRMHMIRLVASMIHLFDWIDFGDIIDKNNFRRFLEECYIVTDILDHEKQSLSEQLEKIAVYGTLEEDKL